MGIKIRLDYRGGIVGPGIYWVASLGLNSEIYYAEIGQENAHEFKNSEEASEAFTKIMNNTRLDSQAKKIFFVDDHGEMKEVFDGDFFLKQLEKVNRNRMNPRDFVV
jgi:hypothetical protein